MLDAQDQKLYKSHIGLIRDSSWMTSKWRILFSSSTEEILTESRSATLEHHSRKHFFFVVSKGEAARRIGCRGYGAP